jgi:tRNA(Glu) U13 pseudouridine synthase TruD
LSQENISLENFKFEKPSFLSVRTLYRTASVQLEKVKLHRPVQDEVFEGMLKQKVEFDLPNGSYATMAIKAMVK